MPSIEINQHHAKEGEVLAELCITLLNHWYGVNGEHTSGDLWDMINEIAPVMLKHSIAMDQEIIKVYAHAVLFKHYKPEQ